MNAFFHAVAFLTRFPTPRLSQSREDWQKSAAYYPLVGLVIGGLLWGAAVAFNHLFLPPLTAALALLVWVYITGGLHLDGWMDLADGLGSYRSREEVLRIMKDSRVGAMGVTAAILLLLLKAALLYEFIYSGLLLWLILLPTVARFFLLVAIWQWPYISDQGLGSGIREGLTLWKLALGLSFTVLISFFLAGAAGVAALALALWGGWWLARRISLRLGGLTGDAYGALVEGIEVLTALSLLLSWRWFA